MMATYKLLSGNIILADQPFIDENHPGAVLVTDVPQPVARQVILSKLEFMNRLTDAEMAGIYTAAKSSVAVEIWLEKFKLATEINLDDPAVMAGLQAMEAAGLIAAGRAAEIMS